jgi:hypothetical protein
MIRICEWDEHCSVREDYNVDECQLIDLDPQQAQQAQMQSMAQAQAAQAHAQAQAQAQAMNQNVSLLPTTIRSLGPMQGRHTDNAD